VASPGLRWQADLSQTAAMAETAPPLMSFDRVAGVYDATRGMPPEAAKAVGAGLARILGGVSRSPRVLEVGVGTGRIAVPLAAEGVRVVGIDISRGMVELLRGKTRDVQPVLAEAARQPFRRAVFDAALFVHILHLVPDAEATLDASIQGVRPGGLLVAGATRHEPGPAGEAGRHIRDFAESVLGRPLHQERGRSYRAAEGFRESMARRGIELESIELARWATAESGRRLLDDFATQTHSWSWDVPAELVAGIAAQAAPGVERICDGLDREVEVTNTFVALVGRLP
jgi:SAM-dependent methyltransferase